MYIYIYIFTYIYKMEKLKREIEQCLTQEATMQVLS